jgi:hypothetical protein
MKHFRKHVIGLALVAGALFAQDSFAYGTHANCDAAIGGRDACCEDLRADEVVTVCPLLTTAQEVDFCINCINRNVAPRCHGSGTFDSIHCYR